ncbi:biotin transporter BioY [Aeromicrobium sp. 636]|uniref:Biotin transporter n=1 Tax=Aeromicrobium senzhongii TaxID=2663859 RepID=A0A8I0K1P3_9ACTN|nr:MULTISPECIES: biotin transporter BioY [Aeromicrobium]MBC9227123.1 biotin transporter BioY [Aeromicrobium senzhongii]MCQ3999223.1 biotin transporter BioY [Aeromicrobium sp. 636]
MTGTTTRPGRSHVATDVALVATFAAFIAVCAQFTLPFSVNGLVEFSLQPLAVLLCGAVLGARRGFLAVVLYLALGAAGLPVFAQGGSGAGQFVGATGGYLLTFPLVALATGLAAQWFRGPRRPLAIVVGGAIGLVLNWLAGALSFSLVLDLPYSTAAKSLAVFLPADFVKLAIVAVVATAVHRAFPQLLGRR